MKYFNKPPTLSEVMAVGARSVGITPHRKVGQIVPQFNMGEITKDVGDAWKAAGEHAISQPGFKLPDTQFLFRFSVYSGDTSAGCAVLCLVQSPTDFTDVKCMLFKRTGARSAASHALVYLSYDAASDTMKVTPSDNTEEKVATSVAAAFSAFCGFYAEQLTHGGNMASRSFERTTFGNTFGQRAVPGYQITCSECGAVEKITANTFGGSMAPEGIAQRFRNKGWKISTKGNRDICPACAGNQASHHNKPEPAIEQTSNIVSINSAMTKAPITEIEQPREMTRADRRVIFAKLEDVYIDEKHGYDAGWGDARVAKDLGVPQDWVRQIREENFGVENSNPEADALLRQARGILDEAKQALADHEHAMQAALKSGDDKRKKLAADVARIEIRLNEMLKIIGR